MSREIILAKVSVDSRRRVYFPKDANILDICSGDIIAITKETSSNHIKFVIQRDGKVAKVWRLAEEAV